MKTVIIDDENHSREILKKLLNKHCADIEIVGMEDTVENAIECIKINHPDIVFLDIELGDETGFEILESFDEVFFSVIFVTAFNYYAIKAIKFSALDYILKPIDVRDLIIAVDKAKNAILSGNSEKGMNNIKFLMKQSSWEKPDRIALPNGNGYIFTRIDEIVRCYAESNYTRFYFTNKKNIIICHTLKEYEDLFLDYDFCRVHNSHLVNLQHVVSFTKGKGGYITMSDGSSVEVSTRKKELFLKRFAGT